MELQLLVQGVFVLLPGDIALVQHFIEDIPVAADVGVRVDIGVVHGGVVGDADQTGALGQAQIRHVLAEIGPGGAAHPGAVLPQIDGVEVPLHDLIFGVLLFKDQGPENLDELSPDDDLVVFGQILDELLGDGGGAVGGVSEEHVHGGAGRAQPVHAVVIPEPLVLDGYAGKDQVRGDLVVGGPDAVFLSIELLQLLIRAGVIVVIVNDGGLVQGEALNGQLGLGDQIVFHIYCENAEEDQQRQEANQ